MIETDYTLHTHFTLGKRKENNILARIQAPCMRVSAALIFVLFELVRYGISFILYALEETLGQHNEVHFLRQKLRNAQSWEKWREIAHEIDVLDGAEQWRADHSDEDLYDWRVIENRTQSLRIARRNSQLDVLAQELREGLIRNLGGINHWKLYSKALTGTKKHIEEYVDEVVYDLLVVEAADGVSYLTKQRKIDIFHDTRQAFGITALVLYGGATFGLFHLGVVKALYAQGLLPRVISGTAVGALIAALVGSHTDIELPEIFKADGRVFGRFSINDHMETPRSKLARFLKLGYFMNIDLLSECVKDIVGDLTFEDAYKRTRRVLNITVSTNRKDVPELLNFITAPNVLIWSAAVASNANLASSNSPIELLCRDHGNNIVPWSTTEVQWRKWNSRRKDEYKLPAAHMRMGELFNVNHYIVSQANPYMNPFLQIRNASRPKPGTGFLGRRWIMAVLDKTSWLILGEFRLRMMQLSVLGLLPNWGRDFLTRDALSGDVSIIPGLSLVDLKTMILPFPSGRALDYWILKGEQATWPLLADLSVRLSTEKTLDGAYTRLTEPSTAGRVHVRMLAHVRRKSLDDRPRDDKRSVSSFSRLKV